MRGFVLGLLFLLTTFTEAGWAQFEYGIQTTLVPRENPLLNGSFSVGARSSYDLHWSGMIVAPEVEFNYFGELPEISFAQIQLLAGARAGFRTDHFGWFIKARPGLVHFFSGDFTQANGTSTNLAADAGVVFEYFFRPGMALRLDCGDSMIRFPHAVIVAGPNVTRPAGWYHSLQSGVGLSARF